MGGPKGNRHPAKLTTDDLKIEAFNQFCDHLAQGKSKKSWYFEHPDLTCTWETMENYINSGDKVFDLNKIHIAVSKGYKNWEQVVEDSAKGKNTRANTATLQMLMRNKYGWDKHGLEETVSINDAATMLLGQITEYQIKVLNMQDNSLKIEAKSECETEENKASGGKASIF